MANTVKGIIEHVLKIHPKDVILVSGGSAWADHVAVQLYLEGGFGGFELYLPTEFDLSQKRYIHSHEGQTLNKLFSECQAKTGSNVFEKLARVIGGTSVKTVVRKGFLARNTLISENCDYLIAFTFSADVPKEGGTFDTWKKTPHSNKINIDLSPCP